MNQYDLMLEKVTGIKDSLVGAYSLRLDGASHSMQSTENIKITKKTDKPGIDILVASGTKGEQAHIPVILNQSGIKDFVYNDFYIGEDCDILIIAGCGINNCGCDDSAHDGIHSFHIGKNSRVRYTEKHYAEGSGTGKRLMNPTTEIEMDENSYMEMDTVQIGGVDDTSRTTKAVLNDGATLVVSEKIMTEGDQYAKTDFVIELNGVNSSTHVVSRSVAKGDSKQLFISNVKGNNVCSGHTECDAIIMDNASVSAIPEISANSPDASLIHEAAIGKIAGEQLIKLMTLGLTEEEAEMKIVNGFLK